MPALKTAIAFSRSFISGQFALTYAFPCHMHAPHHDFPPGGDE
jgi:hypothetical protein